MTPREVVAAYLQKICDLSDHSDPASQIGASAQESAQILIDALKAEGLFIGPLVATPEMCRNGGKKLDTPPLAAGDAWRAMVEEWQRGEGA